MRRRQAIVAVYLSLLFIVIYGACNRITGLRSDVGTLHFAWERHVPLVPLMILPYMSIDLFFVGAPFLLNDHARLRLFARRVTVAILLAAVFFLALPMRFAFARPVVDGWLGPIFKLLHGFDQPYNLFPSLHVILLAIVGGVYLEHTSGVLRRVLLLWFACILASTLLTWQHHVLDVAGGAVAATVIFYVFPRDTAAVEPAVNRRVGLCYAGGAAMFLVLAVGTWPWGIMGLWPATALGIMVAGYWGLGAAVWRKHDGRLPAAARWLLAPCRLGHWLSWRHYRRRCRAWDQVEPGVLIGGVLEDEEARAAVANGVRSVLDVTAEFSEAAAFRDIDYLNIPVLDLTAPSLEQLERAVEFVETHRVHGQVFVHCKIGFSRSAAVVGAWLLHARLATSAEEAIGRLRAARPGIVIRAEVRRALEEFARRRAATNEEEPTHGNTSTAEDA